MRLEEAIYHAFNNTRGVGGTVCPKSWMDLPKVERKRWIRIAEAIATRFAPRKVVWPEERFSAKRNSAERDFGFDIGRTACIKAYEESQPLTVDRGKIAEIIEGTKAWRCLHLEVNDEILADVVWYLSTAIANALEKGE